ncbi:hypothetical protein NGF19_05985 [Streptomyces sp. RY43-2]|uniref:Secreted protein n=1 Tax=Streptomyces macrolidinus TaxID=2952607 RepID=A0ABT0Z9B8_9ACTN|nr:hypothetical protein [Streptomyces macrolidinus]MCN9240348.1 hypothetical protein [Streptomyces macrolidinus]
MKKRSMLAIASLAAGFVVAAVTPSHAADHETFGELNVKDALSTVDHTVDQDGLAGDEGALGQNG